jgi:hypothetical protein
MPQEIDDLLAGLSRHDVDAATSGRIRSNARPMCERRPPLLADVYGRILEPVLVSATVVASLAWALTRIHSLL